MSILKGILKYGLILIALLVGSAFVLGAVMVLIPSVSVFGIRYAKVEQEGDGYKVVSASDIAGITGIEVNSDKYNVFIQKNSKNRLSIDVKLSAIGFYKTQYKEVEEEGEKFEVAKTMEETFMPATNLEEIKGGFTTVLTIDVTPVQGLLSYTQRDIIISIPGSISSVNLVSVESTEGSVNVTGITTDELVMKTDSGDQNLKNVVVNNILTSESRKGAVNVGYTEGKTPANYRLNGNQTTFTNKFGNITFADGIDVGDSSEDKLTINNDKGNVTLNNVYASFDYTAEAGLVNIKSTSAEVNIVSNDAKFNIETVTGTAFGFSASGTGALTFDIGTFDVNTVYIKTGSGAVNIDILQCYKSTTIETTIGNVDIERVKSSIVCKTESGNITMAQPPRSESPRKDITMVIETVSGSVDLSKIVCGVEVKSSNGKVDVSVLEVNADISVETGIGTPTVLLPVDSTKYDIVTAATGTVSVEDLSVIVSTNQETVSHFNHNEGECTDANHVVTVKSSGGNVVVKGIVRD